MMKTNVIKCLKWILWTYIIITPLSRGTWNVDTTLEEVIGFRLNGNVCGISYDDMFCFGGGYVYQDIYVADKDFMNKIIHTIVEKNFKKNQFRGIILDKDYLFLDSIDNYSYYISPEEEGGLHYQILIYPSINYILLNFYR